MSFIMNSKYCLGAMLLDKNESWKILKRSIEPLFEPEEPHERNGFFGNVIFTCGLLQKGSNIRIYYGASDEVVARLDTTVEFILQQMQKP